MSILDIVGDDVLRCLVRCISDYAHRYAFARCCRRVGEAVRDESTLWIDLRCGTWECFEVGLSAAAAVIDGRLAMPVRIDVVEEALAHYSGRLRWALELLLLAHRRSVATVGLHSLRLFRRDDLPRLLPGLAFHLAGAAMLGGKSSGTSLARGLLRGGRAARRAAWRPAAWRAAWRAMCFLHIGPKTKKK